MKKFLVFLIGVALLPVTLASLMAFFETVDPQAMAATAIIFQSNPAFFLYGLGTYFVFHLFFHQPMKTYVFGHELSHAIWGKLFGAKVSDFTVRENSGHVRLSKTNFLITLAPYFFPIYTVLVLLVYGGVWFFYKPVEQFNETLFFLLGLTWGFHLVLTVLTIKEGQEDITSTGVLFSLQFILIVNLEVLKGLLGFMTRGQSFVYYNQLIWSKTQTYYISIWDWVRGLF